MDILLFAVMGLLLGSFYNVCIYRIPRKENIAFPPSHCPNCGHKIRWWENIPVISYVLILRGKCSSCGEKISVQYPLVEFITSLVFGGIYYRYGMSIWDGGTDYNSLYTGHRIGDRLGALLYP